MEDLFYRPQIEPTRDYHSDGVILHQNPDNIPDTGTTPDLNSNIQKVYDRNVETVDRLLRIRQITPLLPKRIVDRINDIIDTITVHAVEDNEGPVQEIIEYEKEKKREEETYWATHKPGIYEVPTAKPVSGSTSSSTDETEYSDTSIDTAEDDDYEWPEMTSSGFDIHVEENKNIWDMASEQYLTDSSLMREAFSLKYNTALEGYVYQLLTAMDEVGVESPEVLNFEYEGETVTGISQDDQHLSDIIVRNQNVLNEMTGLFEKTHDLYKTQEIFGAFDTISQERVRYLKERYKDMTAQNYLEMYDKNLLASSRNVYEQRYILARAEVNRFLYSAAELSSEMLNLALSSNIAKCSLLKKGIDIFAKKEYQNTVYENTAESKLKDLSATGETQTNTQKEPDQNKATDTVKKADNLNIDALTMGGGIGGSIKETANKVKETAAGTVKTIGQDALKQATAALMDPLKKLANKGKGV